MQIKEIRKINEYLDINIPYLEHLAGFYNLSIARAIFSHAVGESVGMDSDRLHAMLFASLWHNAVMLRNLALECLDFSPIHTQVPDTTDATLVESIMNDLANSSQRSPEGKIITLCNQFDHKVFDRTYLKNQDQKIIPAKKVIELMRTEEKIDEELIDIIADLMVVLEYPEEDSHAVCPSMYEAMPLPKDMEHLACEIENNFSPEQQEQLISRLRSDGKA